MIFLIVQAHCIVCMSNEANKNASQTFSNAKDNIGYTPLHYAAQNGNKDIAKLLIQGKADIHAKSDNGLTALHYAAQNGHTDVAKLLIKFGTNINKDITTNDGQQ